MSLSNVFLQTAMSADGTKRWEFVRRHDGFFMYTEDTYVDLRADGGCVDGYWSPSHRSGLFDIAEAAKDDALRTLLWLSDIDTHP